MAILWLVLATVCAAFTVVRVAGLDRIAPLVQLVSFTPYVAAIAAAVTAAAAATGHRAATAVAAAATVALGAAVAPRCTPSRRATTGTPLRVLSANLLFGRADPTALIALARRLDTDVVAVQEFTPEAARALDAAGIAEQFPYRASYPTAGFFGSGVYSRHPLHATGCRTLPSGAFQATGTVCVPGAPAVVVESAHPAAPTFGHTGALARDLAEQPAPTPAGTTGPVTVLLGDFNATADHASFRRLLTTGYRDAATLRGRGLSPTWPMQFRLIPWITLDHVLVDHRTGVTRYTTHRIPGTDHRAVYAELRLPPT